MNNNASNPDEVMIPFINALHQQGFEPNEIEQILQVATPLELPTRHIMHEQGGQPDAFYFLQHGLCHACYLTEEGKEFSKEFYWEGDWIIGFEHLITQQPSPFLLESITAITVIQLPLEMLNQWRREQHSLYIKLLETQLIYKERKERFMLLYTPEQRYQLFCEQFPELLERLTDSQIAAYLGITNVSLSRIKAR